jgi:hypothetical protein
MFQSHTDIFIPILPPPSSFHQLIPTHSQPMGTFHWRLSGLAYTSLTCLHSHFGASFLSKAFLVCRVFYAAVFLHCVEPQASSSAVIIISYLIYFMLSNPLVSSECFFASDFWFIVNKLVSLCKVLPLYDTLYVSFSCSVCPLFLSLFHTFLSPLSRSLSPFFTAHFSDLSFPWDLPSCWFSPPWVNTLPDEWPLPKTLEAYP